MLSLDASKWTWMDGWRNSLHMHNNEGTRDFIFERMKDRVPMQEQWDLAEASSSDSIKKIFQLGKQNMLAYKDTTQQVQAKLPSV